MSESIESLTSATFRASTGIQTTKEDYNFHQTTLDFHLMIHHSLLRDHRRLLRLQWYEHQQDDHLWMSFSHHQQHLLGLLLHHRRRQRPRLQ